MVEAKWSMSQVLATVGWVVSGLMMTTAWLVVLFSQEWRLGVLLAASACLTAIAAATWHVRCYVVRLASVVRNCGEALRRDQDSRPRLVSDSR